MSIIDRIKRLFLPPLHVIDHIKDVQDKQDELQADLKEIKRNLDPIRHLVHDIERAFEKEEKC